MFPQPYFGRAQLPHNHKEILQPGDLDFSQIPTNILSPNPSPFTAVAQDPTPFCCSGVIPPSRPGQENRVQPPPASPACRWIPGIIFSA